MRHFFNKSQSKRRFGRLSVVFGITLGVLAFSACDDNETDDKLGTVSDANINANVLTKAEYGRLEFPRLKDSDENIVVTYKAEEKYGINFCVEWDKKRKTQRWSCYQIYPQNSEINTTRYYSDDEQYPYDKYNDNKEVLSYILMPDPYKGSGFQHGHIVPSQDRLYSEKANIQTFYMTNMQPQYANFNSGIWLNMENQIRTWNSDRFRDTLYVCKGGTIDKGDQILKTTDKGLIVPKYFFMAVLSKNSDPVYRGYKAIGFWVEHSNKDLKNDKLTKYVVSIKELEELTGIDFFCNLPDDIEKVVESRVAPLAWGLK